MLQGYSRFNFKNLPTLDILEEIHNRLGYRLSLDHLANVTLKRQKNVDGLQALLWWKQGRIKDIIHYCQQDVALTRDLFFWQSQRSSIVHGKEWSQGTYSCELAAVTPFQ